MKRILVLLLCTSLIGCAGFQISDNANSKAIAYASGKAFGISINKFTDLDAPLSNAWSDMMTKNAGTDPIPSETIIGFYNFAFVQISSEYNDPYGLIGDLGVFMTLFGAEYVDGKLAIIQPVPLTVAKYFETGYKSGKIVASREGAKLWPKKK